ncbi:MAG: translocation protein TolB, partial [Cyclobacteriaceae bacterium]|nr:translocation protein TolB [Cyclobacteriaceae bacterium]
MKKILAVIILSLPLISSYGQNTREIYGKSRIQYKEFEWQYLESENFEVFFYGPQVGLAREVTDFIEREFDRVTDIMGYPPYSKTKIFLYHSITDLQQSNVGIDYSGPISGGETQFIKSYVEIAHPGSIQKLKEELIFKVTKLLLSEMLYGGSLKDMLQSTLMHLPEWFTEGAAQYIAKGWSIEMDDYIRELSNSDRLTKLQKLHGEEAAYAGQSIWNYIAEKHGKSNISSILNYIRIIRNEEKSIAITLGISFRELIYDWQNYYAEMDGNLNNNYIVPGEDQLIGERNKKGYFIKTVKISPDGVNLAYSTNDRGKYALHLVNLNDGTYSKVTTGGYRVINQDIDYDIPLFDWVDSETLGIIDVKGGNVVFILYDIATGTKIDQVLEGISQVKSISFSKNGRLGILSATHNGRNDLFLISTRRARIRRLTNDIFDDLDPVFVPNTNSILFSSNRVSDTLDLKATDIDLLSNNYNLFTFNLDTTKNVFNRITNTISLDRKPIALNGNEIVYLSDQKGIYNVFKYTISTGIYSQLTNYKRNIKDFDLSPANNTLAIVCLQNSVDQLFLYTGFDYNKQNFTPPSARQQTMQARALKIKRTEEEVSQEVSIKELIDTRLKTIDDAEQDNINTPDTLSREKNTILDTENYTFEEEVKEQPKESESFLTQYRKLKA